MNCLGGLLVIWAEHLHQWLHEATREEDPDFTNFQKVVAIVQAVFRDGALANESTWKKVYLIPSIDGGDFQGIDPI